LIQDTPFGLRYSIDFEYNLIHQGKKEKEGIMETKCPKCKHSFEVEDATKKYRLPLFFILLGTAILAYEHTVNTPSLIITILGDFSVTVGIIWMAVTRSLTGGR